MNNGISEVKMKIIYHDWYIIVVNNICIVVNIM